MTFPPLVEQYLLFLNDAKKFRETKIIDLSEIDFIYPSRLVLVGDLLLKNPNVKYVLPSEELVARYIKTILFNPDTTDNRTYVPVVRLPSNIEERDEKLKRVYEIQEKSGSVFGGDDAFTYVVGELIDNMYQHAKFKNGLITGQKYPNKGFVDLCFLDDGVTIPKNFADCGKKLEPYKAVLEALNGSSTSHEPERGYGLSTSARIFVEGLKGQILVVSGAGAVHMTNGKIQSYALDDNEALQGTLISLRIPYPSASVNIYSYLE